MKRSRAELWRTAIHEAGHAVVARVLGLASGQATIVPKFDLEEAGHHINRSPWRTLYDWEKRGLLHRTVRSAVRGRIMAYMAGAEAEIEFVGACEGGDSDDRDKIEEMADSSDSYLTPEEWKRYEPRMRRQTRRLVRRHRAKIERLASALMDCETLQPEQIDRIIR